MRFAVLFAVLIAAPLAGQDTIPLPGQVLVFNGDSIFITINVNDLSAERIVEVFEALQESLDSATVALRDCDRCEEEARPTLSSTTTKIATGAFTLIGFLLVKYVRDIAQKDHADKDPTEETDQVGEGRGGRR